MSKKPGRPTEITQEAIVGVALDIAAEVGLAAVSGSKVAARLGVSRAAVAYHVQSMGWLRKEVMRRAIDGRVLSVVAQGLASGDATAHAAPEEVRQAAAAGLVV